MITTYRLLKVEQTDRLLRPWQRLKDATIPRGGWIRTVREALGMTAVQLATRLRVTQQAVAEFEKSEAAGKITLESLNKLANALGCKLVYAIVPDKPLAEIRHDRAEAKAQALLKTVTHSMQLEAQGVGKREGRRQINRFVDELLRGSPRKLWD